MKFPIPLLLYTVSLGLAGLAGWTIYGMLPLLSKETRAAAQNQGTKDATDKIALGRGQNLVMADWQYGPNTSPWWAEFKAVNFIGKLPPPPPEPVGPKATEQEAPVVDVRPLEQIIELVSLVYDPNDQGKGDLSHVIVRYRVEAAVQPPEWYMRELASAQAAAGPAAMPRDTAAPTRVGGNPGGPVGRTSSQPLLQPKPIGNRPTTAMPSSPGGKEVLQKVWVKGDGDPRRDPHLWPPFEGIRLVRVHHEAQSAFFVRAVPPPKDGKPVEEPKEEELLKSALGLDQGIVRELHRLNGKPLPGSGPVPTKPVANNAAGVWQENQETTLVNNVRHIGRKDEQIFRENPDELWEKIHVDTYVSKVGSARGLQVRHVDPKIASTFGIATGDVLLEVNGRAVQTQAQAVQFGKGEYKKGVRTFVTKWISGGQIVERIYQAPDR